MSALTAFLDTWGDDMLAMHVGETLTCGEADALIDLFEAHGYEMAAETWRNAHAAGDDEGDSHYEGEEED